MGVVGGNEAGMVSQMGPRRHTARTQHVQGSQSGMPVVCTYRLLSTGNVRASLHRLCLQGLGLPQVQTTPASAKQPPPPAPDKVAWFLQHPGKGYVRPQQQSLSRFDELHPPPFPPIYLTQTYIRMHTSQRRPQYPSGCSM
jgi:hypothetical protein